MIVRLFRHRALWALVAAVPLTLLAAAGCNQDQYAADLFYPLRTDPVIEAPTADPKYDPQHFDLPGEFPRGLLTLFRDLPPQAGAKISEPSKNLSGQERDQLRRELDRIFGRPAAPTVKFDNEASREALDLLRLDDQTLAHGSQLYRRHCLQCHGLTGDGRGHTAPWINPHPRDFRKGMFKFTSSSADQGAARKARRDDLLRTICLGVDGTPMPAFGILPEDDLQALASYVIHLSLRGETELYATFQRGDKSIEEAVADGLESFIGFWRDTNQKVIQPPRINLDGMSEPDRLASVTRGFEFFSTNCLSCHENYGRRDVYKYDAWGTIVRPADLTAGVYRGGRRPIDLYWRIYGGINGANMPATVPTPMRPEQVWDVVNFVRALPYPPMLPRDPYPSRAGPTPGPSIRNRIYPPEKEVASGREATNMGGD